MVNDGSWWELDPIKPGDFYEDCRYHPVLCVMADYSPSGDDLQGISLVDGGIGSCSPRNCGPIKVTPMQAIHRRINWAEFEAVEIPRLLAEIDTAIKPDGSGQVGHVRRRAVR
jgi:hypothetical protein